MNTGQTIFSQIMSFVPKYEFDKRVKKYDGNYRIPEFSCWDQFLCMSFAQLTYRESLRDIEACLNAQPNKLYHMGIKGHATRTNLAHANRRRDWRIYAKFAQLLIVRARKLYQDDPEFLIELDHTVYALDSTTIDLCLSLFPWAKFRKNKGAVKLQTLLDIQGLIPVFIEITSGLVHDVSILDVLIPEPGSFYVMDRAYLDFHRLHRINKHFGYFIIRAKRNMKFRRLYSRKVDKSSGVLCDHVIRVTGFYAQKDYPDKLRRVKYHDEQRDESFAFLTNNFEIPALTVAESYCNRWKVELFFKWIKQHLRIKSFYGTSPNAVKSQIWIAISVYVIVAMIKKILKIELKLYTMLQIFSVSLFEKGPIFQLLTDTDYTIHEGICSKQLNLFEI